MSERILIAEDDVDQRTIITHFLKSQGYETHTVVDGQEALDLLATDKFDLLIVDMAMPNVDGWTVIGQLRTRLENLSLPVIALTAHDFAQDQARAFQAGCNEFVSKPFDPYQLLEKVQRLLSAPAGGPTVDPSAV